jgi:hypothetical protein
MGISKIKSDNSFALSKLLAHWRKRKYGVPAGAQPSLAA